jgi:hypothetical protein
VLAENNAITEMAYTADSILTVKDCADSISINNPMNEAKAAIACE